MREAPTLEQTIAAYTRAREAADAAITVAHATRDAYVHNAVYHGLSTRDIARALGVPKSTIHRIRLRLQRGWFPQTFTSPEGWVRAHNHAWADAPTQQTDRAPFSMRIDADGNHICTLVAPLGVARLTTPEPTR